MARADKESYAAKHPAGKTLNKKIAAAVQKRAVNAEINCADATAIAENMNFDMLDVGATIDLLDIRLKRCQMGLFGYGLKKLVVEPAAEVSGELERAIRGNLVDGRLPCVAAWAIADRAGMARMAVAAACEKLKIKIKPCQLGAF
jgi:hypothetical protein